MRAIRTLFVFQDMLVVSGLICGGYYNPIGATCFGLGYLFIVIARECMVHDYKIG